MFIQIKILFALSNCYKRKYRKNVQLASRFLLAHQSPALQIPPHFLMCCPQLARELSAQRPGFVLKELKLPVHQLHLKTMILLLE